MALQYRAELEGRADDLHGGRTAVHRHGGGFDDHGVRSGGSASSPTGAPGGRGAPVRAEGGIAEVLGTDRAGREARKDRGRIRIHRRAGVGSEGIPVCQRRGEEQAVARLPGWARRDGARDRRSRWKHARCEGPAGHDGERSARHHPGGSGRQVQGARRQVRRQEIQQPERCDPRARMARCISPIPRWTCRRARSRSFRTRACSAWVPTDRCGC